MENKTALYQTCPRGVNPPPLRHSNGDRTGRQRRHNALSAPFTNDLTRRLQVKTPREVQRRASSPSILQSEARRKKKRREPVVRPIVYLPALDASVLRD